MSLVPLMRAIRHSSWSSVFAAREKTKRLIALASTAAALLCPLSARADLLNDLHTSGTDLAWIEYHNATADFHQAEKDALKADHRLISLSLAGSAAAPRYAAVWVKATAPDQHFSAIINAAGDPCCTQNTFYTKNSDELVLGYSPVLVTAVGDDEGSAKYAAVWERFPPLTELHHGAFSASDFASLNKLQRAGGFMLGWVALFGTPAAPLYLALYEPLGIPGSNGLPRWADSTTDDVAAFNDEFDAYAKEWVRPALLAGAPDGSFVAGWYDSLLPAAASQVQAQAFPDLDAASLDAVIPFLQTFGLLPMQVQAIKRDGSLHYSVVFGDKASILADPERRLLGLPRTFDSNGQPDLTLDPTQQPFEDHMKKFMLNNGVRAATLAVAKDGRLVFARAYTWAEVDGGYPITTPTNRFRVGSVSKVFTMVLACKLEEDGKLSLGDLLIDDLNSPPTPKDPRFANITLRDLIAHRSGLPRTAANPPVISKKLNGGAVILPISRDDQTLYEVEHVKLLSNPGQKYHYSNLAYFFVGEAAADRFGIGYDAAVRDKVFASLFPAAHHPEVTKSTFEDQSPNEVRYHTNSLQLVSSVVDSAEPLVPVQYGGNDYNLKAASGGWAASAAQLAKTMALFSLPPNLTNPLLDAQHLHSSEGNGMLDFLKLIPCKGCVPVIDFSKTMGGLEIQNNFFNPSCSLPPGVTSYGKNGGVPGIRAEVITRDDGLTMAVVVTGDTGISACKLNQWAAKVDWSKVPTATDYFPIYNVLAY